MVLVPTAFAVLLNYVIETRNVTWSISYLFMFFLVSTAKTFQVQYIQQGILEIDTTNARWIHKLSSNGSMVYSYYGEIETRQLKALSIQYKVAKFEFQTPILINGSAEVKLSGLHSLVVSSEEGIYIGVDIAVGKPKVNEDKAVGGYCVRNSRAPGNTLYLETVSITRATPTIFGLGSDSFSSFRPNPKRKDRFPAVLAEDLYLFFS